ncbi:MAG TPA: hypothetical protein DEG17_06995 [Cyanobacteria bacterium UBA11149]|nr:hypothetical protein [Cyanobacteria bacterium UBA11367]HBE60429.1 hypothetical protein [Cyanobacteria bacterium UBA11366]HBK64371.1 hypothetical protein [Cyanobacteria bacterium UBA11166]HBR73976.1 hypothetical protein [Cyanobacteria bacterium UBA11159]HBS70111.1 hypothetical protein [Cyanobacteria bacterium UBA11153]HBW88613.1 hypothetical protein [Cyanobacteria bacterium UBA11149]HCA97119.1 hypothetical protein [Cyanobacteria bacterium UBA9226]
MSTEIQELPANIEEMVAKILVNRQITKTEQLRLKFALLYQDGLHQQDRSLIDRVFYGIRHGLLKVIE